MHIQATVLRPIVFVAALLVSAASFAQEPAPPPDAAAPTEQPTPPAEPAVAEPAPAVAEPVAPAPAEPAPVAAEASASLAVGPVPGGASGDFNHEKFNLRFAGGVAFGLGSDLSDLGYGDLGGQGAIGMDWVLVEPLALSILATYTPFESGESNKAIQDLSAGLGLRLRLFPGKGGPANAEGGTIAGNLMLDAHFAYHNYLHDHHAGYNVGIGYELALAKRFNMGPYGRFQHVFTGEEAPNYMMFAVGLQISVGAQMEPDDGDKDGIPDETDKCPTEAEDKDGFEDENGCPDTDNDGDGVPDLEDKCPDVKGDASAAGCVNEDRDGDGIKNDVDQCPDEAEDKDGVDDEDGCPSHDKDGDSFTDDKDACPDVAGVAPDGCPPKDSDNDGILDDQDKCPAEAETKNGFEDTDGCPDEIPEAVKKFTGTMKGITFASGKATIAASSNATLDSTVALLNEYPTLKIAIRGHTDDKGTAEANLELSRARAQAVKDYVVGKGIEEGRITAEGLGPNEPIADNKTGKGRGENRRIEFKIIVD